MVLPWIDWPITIYALFFVLGFLSGYLLILPKLRRMALSHGFSPEVGEKAGDSLLFMMQIGALLGARIGHVLFYDFPYYQRHFWQVFNLREGGLSSHGAALGMVIALFFFLRKWRLLFVMENFFTITYRMIPSILVAAVFIRIGNFFNQEILGVATGVDWGVIFGHAVDGICDLPRHPVQLYEALWYGWLFVLFSFLDLSPRRGVALFLILVLGGRMCLEYFKAPQSLLFHETWVHMGQILSLPFIIWGLFLWISEPVVKWKKEEG